MRRWRKRNPMRAQYERLKAKAKARKIEFTLSYNYFKTFCELNRYHEQTGNEPHCMTVDRINNLQGYVPGNIQPLTRRANSIKRMKQDAMRQREGYKWRKK